MPHYYELHTDFPKSLNPGLAIAEIKKMLALGLE